MIFEPIKTLLAASTLVLAACTPALQTGTWNLITPDGKSSSVEVSLLREGEYYLRAQGNPISGVYLLDARQLRMSKPDQPRMEGNIWQWQQNGELTLVAEPPFTVSGVRQTSATMRPAR